MVLKLEINGIKPVGLNHSHLLTVIKKRVMRIKTTVTRDFESDFSARIAKYQDKINEVNNYYDYKTHHLAIDYEFYIPVLTKDRKKINQRSGDLDGLIKVTQDCLFKKLKADDSEITEFTAKKIHSDEYKIKINILVCDRYQYDQVDLHN